MLIRSQNKEVLAVFENLLDVEVSGGVISARKDNGWYCLLGEYSAKTKAMKVLDMIQGAYADYQTARTVSNGLATMSLFVDCSGETNELYMKAQNALGKSTVFQMPADSEVEA